MNQLHKSPIELRDLYAVDVLAEIRFRIERLEGDGRLHRLLELILEHLFDRELNVNFLKLKARLRDNSVTIDFHRIVGEPPKSFIVARRMRVAQRLLMLTNLKIWEIADLVGYSQLGVFSKAFSRIFEVRPNLYRKQLRDPDGVVQATQLTYRFLARVLAGNASPEEAQSVIARLRRHYPEADP